MRIEEFEPEKAWWSNRTAGPRAWALSIDEIRSRGYNLDAVNPLRNPSDQADPERLLADLEEHVAEAARLRSELVGLIAGALEGAE